jgi:hypothetical protein
MTGGQVPLWVTILISIITFIGALGGALGGQLLAARRDDRRWEREARREDARWEREREREQQRLTHEARLHWREQRQTAYSDFLADADNAIEQLVECGIEVTSIGRASRDSLREQDQRVHAARRSRASVQLVASKSVRDAATKLTDTILDMAINNERSEDETGLSEKESPIVQLRVSLDEFMDEVRKELAIDINL